MTSVNEVSIPMGDSSITVPVSNNAAHASDRNYVVISGTSQTNPTYVRISDLTNKMTDFWIVDANSYDSTRFTEHVTKSIAGMRELPVHNIYRIYSQSASAAGIPITGARFTLKRKDTSEEEEQEEKIKAEEERNNSPPPKQPELKKSKSTENAAATTSEPIDALDVVAREHPEAFAPAARTQAEPVVRKTAREEFEELMKKQAAKKNPDTEIYHLHFPEGFGTNSASGNVSAQTQPVHMGTESQPLSGFESLSANHTESASATTTEAPSKSQIIQKLKESLIARIGHDVAASTLPLSTNAAQLDSAYEAIATIYASNNTINLDEDLASGKASNLVLLLHGAHKGKIESFLPHFLKYHSRLVNAPTTAALETVLKSSTELASLASTGGLIRWSGSQQKFYVCTSPAPKDQFELIISDSQAKKS